MRNLIYILILFFLFSSCKQQKPEVAKAKTAIENLIMTIDKEDYINLSQYYTDALNEGEPEHVRTEKLDKLKRMLGGVEKVTFLSSVDTLYNDQPALFLIYKIKHKKAFSTQQFTVIIEKGEYRIARQNIESIN